MKGKKNPTPNPGFPQKRKTTQRIAYTGLHPPTEPCCHLGERSLCTAAVSPAGREVNPEPPCICRSAYLVGNLNIQDHLTAAENLFPKEILFTALILGYLTYCLKEKSHSYLPDCQLSPS